MTDDSIGGFEASDMANTRIVWNTLQAHERLKSKVAAKMKCSSKAGGQSALILSSAFAFCGLICPVLLSAWPWGATHTQRESEWRRFGFLDSGFWLLVSGLIVLDFSRLRYLAHRACSLSGYSVLMTYFMTRYIFSAPVASRDAYAWW
jgi:hypothetical protein